MRDYPLGVWLDLDKKHKGWRAIPDQEFLDELVKGIPATRHLTADELRTLVEQVVA